MMCYILISKIHQVEYTNKLNNPQIRLEPSHTVEQDGHYVNKVMKCSAQSWTRVVNNSDSLVGGIRHVKLIHS